MKIIASLIVLGLCANVCFAAFGVAPTSSSQSGSVSTSLLYTTKATQVYSAGNTTDAKTWDASSTTTTSPATGVTANGVIFGPATSNTTSYVYGLVLSSSNTITSIIKRTVSNSIVLAQNDTASAEAVVTTADSTITSGVALTSSAYKSAVAPGYLALLTNGPDTAATPQPQIFLTIVSGTTATAKTITATADATSCAASGTTPITTTTYTIGNVWYDIGTTAFFYTYSAKVASTACSSGTSGSTTTTYAIYLGGYFPGNSTAFWKSPLSITPTTAANAVTNVVGGGDNWLNATNIYVVYKDATAGKVTTYVSKTAVGTTTTAAGAFGTLVADVTTGSTMTYLPIGVWASDNTYGISVSNVTVPTSGSTTYTITNYLNGTTSNVSDSGLSYSSAASAPTSVVGWPLNTGYTIAGVWPSASTSGASVWAWGSFYGNGTVNVTAATLVSSVKYPVSVYADVNGSTWIGWTDYDTSANTDASSAPYTYAGYLATLQGQIYPSTSGASVLSVISAFVTLFLAAIFVF